MGNLITASWKNLLKTQLSNYPNRVNISAIAQKSYFHVTNKYITPRLSNSFGISSNILNTRIEMSYWFKAFEDFNRQQLIVIYEILITNFFKSSLYWKKISHIKTEIYGWIFMNESVLHCSAFYWMMVNQALVKIKQSYMMISELYVTNYMRHKNITSNLFLSS